MDGAPEFFGKDLQAAVGAVAERGRRAVLAAAEIDRLGFSGLKLNRGKVGDLVAAVAERLLGAKAAGAPEVAFAGFDLYWIRAFLSNGWFGHWGNLLGRY